MINKLIEQLHEDGCSCVIAQGETIRSFKEKGVRDLYFLLKTDSSFLKGSLVADKVVGKAAAVLMILGGVKEMYTDLISQPALFLIEESGIKIRYKELVPHIENRDKSGWCPLEKACVDHSDLHDIFFIIERFINSLHLPVTQTKISI